jgi:hypothetical protein
MQFPIGWNEKYMDEIWQHDYITWNFVNFSMCAIWME